MQAALGLFPAALARAADRREFPVPFRETFRLGLVNISNVVRNKFSGALKMNIDDLVAIDVHTHAEVSCRQPTDAIWEPFEEAASKYFKVGKRPTIAETIAYYRERKIGLVMFTVDCEFQIGNRRIPNEEVAEAARDNADIMIAFASHRSAQGQDGRARGARADRGRRRQGLQVPSDLQGFFPNDRSPTRSTR